MPAASADPTVGSVCSDARVDNSVRSHAVKHHLPCAVQVGTSASDTNIEPECQWMAAACADTCDAAACTEIRTTIHFPALHLK